MKKETVELILDKTYPEWRAIDPDKFQTFEEYASLIENLLVGGIIRLNQENTTRH